MANTNYFPYQEPEFEIYSSHEDLLGKIDKTKVDSNGKNAQKNKLTIQTYAQFLEHLKAPQISFTEEFDNSTEKNFTRRFSSNNCHYK